MESWASKMFVAGGGISGWAFGWEYEATGGRVTDRNTFGIQTPSAEMNFGVVLSRPDPGETTGSLTAAAGIGLSASYSLSSENGLRMNDIRVVVGVGVGSKVTKIGKVEAASAVVDIRIPVCACRTYAPLPMRPILW